jgi:hypothetical protein
VARHSIYIRLNRICRGPFAVYTRQGKAAPRDQLNDWRGTFYLRLDLLKLRALVFGFCYNGNVSDVDNTSNTRKEETLEYTKEMIEAEQDRQNRLEHGQRDWTDMRDLRQNHGLELSEGATRALINNLMIASHIGRIGNVPS